MTFAPTAWRAQKRLPATVLMGHRHQFVADCGDHSPGISVPHPSHLFLEENVQIEDASLISTKDSLSNPPLGFLL